MSPVAIADDGHVIQVRGLTAHYGDREVLSGVDLDVRRGEIMVIIGSSGSGKTTLLRHLLGLQRPTSGRIGIMGRDLTRIRRRELYRLRRQIGVAFQGGALFGSMTVAENVQLPLREHTRLDENTMRIMTRMKLEVVNLLGCEHLMPAELSGGMTKRVALARAVIMDPRLLFFDEPSAGLDPVSSAELDELILRLRSALNMTIVVVTHDLESAFKIADRITVIHQGHRLMTGSIEEVRASDDPRVQAMLSRRPRSGAVDADDYLRRLTDRES